MTRSTGHFIYILVVLNEDKEIKENDMAWVLTDNAATPCGALYIVE